jgi:hypothetical protein
MTGFLPLATFAAGLARVIEGPVVEEAIPEESGRVVGDIVDAEYEGRWDEDEPR